MSPGDILVTEKRASHPVVVLVEDEKKFLARVGQYRGNKALRIDRAIVQSDRV